MIMLSHNNAIVITEAVTPWYENCIGSANPRIRTSYPVQIYNLLSNIGKVVPGMSALTYDLDSDHSAMKDNKGFRDKPNGLWLALAYYLKKLEGVSDLDAYDFAGANWKSLRSGAYSLQSIVLATGYNLFVVAHSTDARDSRIITFDGGYDTLCGKTVAEVAGGRERKRWEEVTKMMFRKGGLNEAAANTLAARVKVNAAKGMETAKQKLIG